MSQPKVYEYAKEIGMETLDLMDKIRKWNLPVKSHMAALDESLIDQIQDKLKEEMEASAAKKKKATKKKKAKAKKKTTAKKATAKKKVTKKKVTTTVKKATTKKVTTKKATTKKKATAKKNAASTVIRRRKSDIEAQAAEEKAAQEAAEKALEVAAQAAAVAAEPTDTPDPDAPATADAPVAAATPEAPKRGRNIVGRIDLSQMNRDRAKRNANAQSAGTADRTPRTSGRNIRPGFVAAPQPVYDAPAVRKEVDFKKEKKKRGSAKEVPQKSFTATDFRKREVIFQPKKKRIATISQTKKTQITTPKASKRVVKIHNTITVNTLADDMGVKAPQLIKKLMAEGVMANMNTELDFDTVSLIVTEFGFEAQNEFQELSDVYEEIAFGNLEAEPVIRPPVITVMGHVDHGKTTLLDAIRNADVVSGEAGGITQHIGAYRVTLEDGKVATFIDTPGHAAFTAMRARGANVTDIVIIVVAADDGVMPQTEEAISHAKAAGVPIIVAVNKIDRPNANVEKIKQQLTEYELISEEWGGDTIFCETSALQKQGIKEILEQIHLIAEVQELKANPERSGTGIVVESAVAKGRGNVATILIKEGTVRKGDFISVGTVAGRVRRMNNDRGETVQSAEPGEPVEIIGLPDTPDAGDRFDICETENIAQDVSRKRAEDKHVQEETPNSGMSLESIFAKVKAGDVANLAIVLKSDVAGSNEAIKGMFAKLDTEEVKVNVIHTGVGAISESDVLLASTAGGLILGFNVRPDSGAQRMAREKAIEIKTYSIIYELIDDVKKAMGGLLTPDIVEESLGRAEVREIFSVPKLGVIAGSSVTDGKIVRNCLVRLLREGKIIYEGNISSLKRFKDDAKEVQSGYECGIGIENYNDIKVGDEIEAYQKKEVERTLE